MSERKEAWMRIIVGIISGTILWVWTYLTGLLILVNWLITIFSGKRSKSIAEFCEIWNTQMYSYSKYIAFVSNERPFPFKELKKNISKFEK
ncbi:MAG: DUF4389 domain-containing protein [Candidatus Woesearchaeota archaeon]|jgi:hypothetical protein